MVGKFITGDKVQLVSDHTIDRNHQHYKELIGVVEITSTDDFWVRFQGRDTGWYEGQFDLVVPASPEIDPLFEAVFNAVSERDIAG